jgi:hypothetical protein
VIDAAGMHRLGAERHIGRQILAQQHRADMQAGARRQRRLQRLQRRLVGEREEDGVVGRIEQQQHAVGLVDLAAAPARQQVARQAVVRRPQRGQARIAQGHAQARAVDHIGQQQRAATTLAHAAGHRWRLCGSMTTQCAPVRQREKLCFPEFVFEEKQVKIDCSGSLGSVASPAQRVFNAE